MPTSTATTRTARKARIIHQTAAGSALRVIAKTWRTCAIRPGFLGSLAFLARRPKRPFFVGSPPSVVLEDIGIRIRGAGGASGPRPGRSAGAAPDGAQLGPGVAAEALGHQRRGLLARRHGG